MKLKPNYKIRDIAGEKVIILQGKVGVDMTKVISLNDSSEYLVNSLKDKEFELQDIVNLLLERYDVDEATAQKDSAAWLDSIKQAGLIE